MSKEKKITKITQEWISGLPVGLLSPRPDLRENYFLKTYVSLKPLKSVGYKLYINPRLVGGMLSRNDLQKMIEQKKNNVNNQLTANYRNFREVPKILQSLKKKWTKGGIKNLKFFPLMEEVQEELYL